MRGSIDIVYRGALSVCACGQEAIAEMRQRPIVVEFLGRSGVGKTAMATLVESVLEDEGVSCRRGVPRADARAWHFATLLSGVTTAYLVARYRLFRKRSGGSVTSGLFRELVRLHWAHHAQADVVLLDQGVFVQLERAKRLRFGRSRAPTGSYHDALRRVKLPHLLVYVTATPERIAERRQLHRDASSVAYEIWHSQNNTIEADLARLQDDAAVQPFGYVVVKNEHPNDDARCAEQIAAKLLKRIHPTRVQCSA